MDRFSRAPRRACLLAAVVLAGALPVARAAAPDSPEGSSGSKPYIVLLKDRAANAGAVAGEHSRRYGIAVTRLYEQGLRGYVGTMTERAAKELAHRRGVLAIAPDEMMATFAEQPVAKTQVLSQNPYASPPIWGLDRIDQGTLPLDGLYHSNMGGSEVTAYVVDTGVKSGHVEFGGRVVTDKTKQWDGYRSTSDALYGEDCNGHGTHVAGTLGGQTFGVAKQVKIVSVRVLDCNGYGLTSTIVAGIDWMVGNHPAGGAAVANMSFGGGTNTAMDAAVNRAIDDGIVVAIAAGNGNILGATDACSGSPARVPRALTVGATDSSDKKASFSNYGSCVDLFAPGVNVVSSYGATGASTSAWQQMSGTSMATPHVAGVAALLLAAKPDASPAAVADAVLKVATLNVVTSANTANPKLLYAPSNLVANQLPTTGAPGSSPPPPPSSTTTTTRSCLVLCGIL